MTTAISPRPAWALALALTLAAAAHGQQDPTDAPPPPPAEEAEAQGFPWLCFFTSVAALGGLFYFVRRRERELGLDRPGARGPERPWYCRACDRDVTGRECPRCGAPNPFLNEHEAVEREGRRR
jgi:hypothetical protein